MQINNTDQQPPKATECPVCKAELSPGEYDDQECWTCGWPYSYDAAGNDDG